LLVFSSLSPNFLLINMGKKDQNPLEGHVSGQSNKPLSKPAHALPFDKVLEETGCDAEEGLTTTKAKEIHAVWGNNDLGEGGGVQPGKILLRQVAYVTAFGRFGLPLILSSNAMTLVLIIAMAVSFAIQSWIEGGVITAIIILNIVVGFMQEFKAEKTMDSLRSLSSPTATAVRDGKTITVPTIEIVPGDMVEMKTGDTVPADVRLVTSL